MLRWRWIGWTAAVGAFLLAAFWGCVERQARHKTEQDARDRMDASTRTLAETREARDALDVQLTQVRSEQEDLSQRYVDSQLLHRTAEDTWLSEKNAMLSRVERLESKLQQLEEGLTAAGDALRGEQARRTEVEAVLAAERDANAEASQRWRQEREVADRLAHRQNESIRDLQKDLSDAQARLDVRQDKVEQLESDLSKTLDERDAAAIASQKTGAALDQAVTDLQKREYDVVALQNMIVQLQHALSGARRQVQQFQHTNQSQAAQIQQLNAQIQQLQAQIRSLTEELGRLRAVPRPPAAPTEP